MNSTAVNIGVKYLFLGLQDVCVEAELFSHLVFNLEEPLNFAGVTGPFYIPTSNV